MVTICLNNHIIQDIELFVFDKDGTLIDIYTYWCNMADLRAERICSFYKLDTSKHKKRLMFEMGVDISNRRLRPEGPIGLLPRAVVQKAAEQYLEKIDCKDVNNVCFQVFKEVDEISLPLLAEFVKPLDGAIELLRQIKKKNGKTAIATTDRTERARVAIKCLNIDSLIDLVVGTDQVRHSKPDPEMLMIIAKQLNVEPSRSVMVGDARTDVQMGINAHFRASIGVCSGLTSKEVLSELTPYVLDDVSKIKIG